MCVYDLLSPILLVVVCFFFFKQKTAYEMRISDWSSDVCSSDLRDVAPTKRARALFPENSMPGLMPNVDPDGLLEYSVVYTDRALNHMSGAFQGVMKDISRTLKQVYNAESAIVVPGSGTFGMEAEIGRASCRERVWQTV